MRICSRANQFQSTPSARRATQTGAPAGSTQDISIHALREEGDADDIMDKGFEFVISIHALREEGDSASLLCLEGSV